MGRYKVVSAWSLESSGNSWGFDDDGNDVVTVIGVQTADIEDTVNGTVYRDGAYRVVTGTVDNDTGEVAKWKPIKTGKGGTVPFYGEMAWADAARLYDDAVFAARRNNSTW